MDRLACINVPSLPLQIALRRLGPGSAASVALVKDDRPSSAVLQLNRAARVQGLRSGMRYSEALAIVPDLQAALVSSHDLALARQDILETLANWSPESEACPFEQGSFWVNSSGLTGLYGSEAQWGAGVRQALAEKRYKAVVVVGLTRGGTYVLARSRRRSTVLGSWDAEKRAMEAAPLSIFPLSLRHRRLLEKLGVKTLAALVRIPVDELGRRFGPELVADLQRLQAYTNLPLQSSPKVEPWGSTLRLEAPVVDRQAFVPLLKGPLEEGLERLRKRARLLAELRLVFVLESGEFVCEVLRPAEPTTNCGTVIRLLDLRLSRSEWSTAVVEIRMVFQDVAAPTPSGELFAPPLARDPRRGAEAIALIRAQWGNGAVVRPVLADSHISELSYRWEAVESLVPPQPGTPRTTFPTAVRRVGLGAPWAQGNPAGQRLGGPCRLRVVSDGSVLDKEYWFLRNPRHEVAWVSWDRVNHLAGWEGMVD